MTPSMKEGCTESLRRNWDAFCDCDPLVPVSLDRDRFIEQMERAGLVKFRTVKKSDVDDDSFAAERGIELGGTIWVLTKAGIRALSGGKTNG